FRKIPIFYIPHAYTHGIYDVDKPLVKNLIKFQPGPDYDLIHDLSLLEEKLKELVLKAKPNVNVKTFKLFTNGLVLIPSDIVRHLGSGIALEKDLWKYREESI